MGLCSLGCREGPPPAKEYKTPEDHVTTRQLIGVQVGLTTALCDSPMRHEQSMALRLLVVNKLCL